MLQAGGRLQLAAAAGPGIRAAGLRTSPVSCSASEPYSRGPRRTQHRAGRVQRDDTQDCAADSDWRALRHLGLNLETGPASTSGLSDSNSGSVAAAHYHVEDGWDLGGGDDYTPFPSNLPTSPAADAWPPGELSAGHSVELWSLTNGMHSSANVGSELWSSLSQVYVILFGVGETETEGIYSLRALSRDEGLPQDTIIAFQDSTDAQRYAGLLEATMEHQPRVCPIEPKELLEFCADAGYKCRLEPHGSLLIPPDYNVGMTDWERSLRLRDGQWSVLERDPDRAVTPSPQPEQPYAGPHNNASHFPQPDPELDFEAVRAALERQFLRET